ncbi:helix-turn-helix domain-containing protein [Pseudoxanthomonas sp. JBR18]|uniref:MarR family winged helix-turn-helix transcriptional regulator n=1 Tax=Pseudoxanthomonas sp. JBR18 TaxID=2969308 RepID=UPI0023051246|nr:helix-turn-helix domain-containing protein [Pseudoxanthomonas sp. JBR18]WCE04905.1 helix-turn-helix domain-containing protein [Pseudoxanthomonas sp. JBR18]
MRMDDQSNPVRELSLVIFAANGRLISAGNELVAHLGLTSAWWQVLAALRYSPVPLPTASLARNMGLTRQAVQRIVGLLAERAMVEFQDNPHHRRAKLIVLTPSGIKALAAAEEAVAQIDQAITERIGSERLQEAKATLAQMSDMITAWMERGSHPTAHGPDNDKDAQP